MTARKSPVAHLSPLTIGFILFLSGALLTMSIEHSSWVYYLGLGCIIVASYFFGISIRSDVRAAKDRPKK